MRKVYLILLIVTLLFPLSLYAAETPAALHIEGCDVIIIGAFDCWVHSDGITWQDTDGDGDRDKPGDGQQQKGTLTVSIPDDLKEQYENIIYIIKPFTSDLSADTMRAMFTQGKGYSGQLIPDREIDICNDYITFELKVLDFRPEDYRLIPGTKTTTFYFSDDRYNTLDIKRMWQNELVQGKRKLLPALVEFYGTPKAVIPPPPVPKEPENLPCMEAPSVANTWETVYSWEVEHSSSWTDPVTGESFSDSWTETVYETVGYYERLSATVIVNTKQGIATDPNNPKPTDRESRGSWEIIPWSRKKGLNPNEVTRAGYGFEVKVQTAYTTDWETKVPAPASAKGGRFSGPDKVVADFYDTQGRYVTRVNMVPTQGKAGDRNITWELPPDRHVYPDGSSDNRRKHYTDVHIPDGTYQVKVTISGAGKTRLCLIQRKNVVLYGDMYDDIYTRVSSSAEYK